MKLVEYSLVTLLTIALTSSFLFVKKELVSLQHLGRFDFGLSSSLQNTTERKDPKQQQQQVEEDDDDSSVENVPVFYNLFIADDGDDYTRAKELVNEQLSGMLPQHSPVYITSIGVKPNASFFGPWSEHHSLRMAAHEETGDEKHTLHTLWEYCQNHTHSKVVYLHSKGTFHPSHANNILRKYLSTGALSSDCLEHLPDTCNICATRMSPLPHPHVSGNMWLARCSYVSRLIDPWLFTDRMTQVQRARNSPCHGTGRAAQEHWIHSHPTNRPCDLDNSSQFTWAYTKLPEGGVYSSHISEAPRFEMSHYFRRACRGVGQTREERLSEYKGLYSEEPPPSWWGWKFYPASEPVLANSTPKI